MVFDYKTALDDGASKAEIVQFVRDNKLEDFNFDKAYERGADDDMIFEALANRPRTDMLKGITPRVIKDPDTPQGPAAIAEPGVEEPQVIYSGKPYEAPREDIVAATDTKTTEQFVPDVTFDKAGATGEFNTLGMATDPNSTKVAPMTRLSEYEARASKERDLRASGAQKLATESSFAQSYVDPQTGEKVAVQPGGLETDIPILTGKLAAVRMLSNPIIAKAVEKYATVAGTTFSKEALHILGRNPELTPEAVEGLLKEVPKQDQAYVLSRALGPEGEGYIKQAVNQGDDEARIALMNELKAPRNKLIEALGDIDIDRAKAKYADMIDEVATDYKNVADATPILKDLDFLERFYGTTPSVGNRIVNQMKATLSENKNLNLSDALEFRADLNELLRKANRGREKIKLKSIKNNVDSFIDSVATVEQKAMIDDAIGTYSRTMQNREVADIIAKHSKSGDTILEDGKAIIANPNAIATDWVKVRRELTDARLNTPEAMMATRVVEKFSERFAGDKALEVAARVKGSNADSGGVLGAWGYAINTMKDVFALYGNRAQNLAIQGSILKSLKNSKTNREFIDSIIASKTIPQEAKGPIVKALQIGYNPTARQTGDVNLNPVITPVGGTTPVTDIRVTPVPR